MVSNSTELLPCSVGLAPVTVIIPCYRCADTIGRAVDSIIAQSFVPAEIIFIEDESKDNDATLHAIMAAEEKLKGIMRSQTIVMHKNAGPASARNVGWNKASQPFIAFLDADDSWHPSKIELQLNWMMQNPSVSITGHGTEQINSEVKFNVLSFEPVTKIMPFNMLWKNPFSTRSVMLKTDINCSFPENIYFVEDGYLWAEIVCSEKYIAYVSSAPLAFTYKDIFGASGLSRNLWKMEKGEIRLINFVCKLSGYSIITKIVAMSWSLTKYIRRVAISAFNRYK